MRRKKESRRAHLSNGLAALVDVWSETGWRRDPLASLSFSSRDRALSNFHYAVSELRRAAARPARKRRRHRLILAVVPSVAAAVALAARARPSAAD